MLTVAGDTDWWRVPDNQVTPFQRAHVGFMQWQRKVKGRMELAVRQVGQPWVNRIEPPIQAQRGV